MFIGVTIFHRPGNMSTAGYCHLCSSQHRRAAETSEEILGQILIFNCLAIPHANGWHPVNLIATWHLTVVRIEGIAALLTCSRDNGVHGHSVIVVFVSSMCKETLWLCAHQKNQAREKRPVAIHRITTKRQSSFCSQVLQFSRKKDRAGAVALFVYSSIICTYRRPLVNSWNHTPVGTKRASIKQWPFQRLETRHHFFQVPRKPSVRRN